MDKHFKKNYPVFFINDENEEEEINDPQFDFIWGGLLLMTLFYFSFSTSHHFL